MICPECGRDHSKPRQYDGRHREAINNAIKQAIGSAAMTPEEHARQWWGSDDYPHREDFDALVEQFRQAREQALEELDILRKALNRRVTVEQRLLDAANGKAPLPDADECRALSLKLGTPPEWFERPMSEREQAPQLDQLQQVLSELASGPHESDDKYAEGRCDGLLLALSEISALKESTPEGEK